LLLLLSAWQEKHHSLQTENKGKQWQIVSIRKISNSNIKSLLCDYRKIEVKGFSSCCPTINEEIHAVLELVNYDRFQPKKREKIYFMGCVNSKTWRMWCTNIIRMDNWIRHMQKEKDTSDSLIISLPWQTTRNAPIQKTQCQYKRQEAYKESTLANNISTPLT